MVSFKKTFTGSVELGHLSFDAGDTPHPMTVPLMFRVGGANEHIGHAVVEVENGLLKIVGVNMVELGLRLLDLGAVFTTDANPLEVENKSSLSIRNNRPKPDKVTAIITDVQTRREELIREGYKMSGDYAIDYDGSSIPLENAKKTDGTPLFPDNIQKETNG